MESERFRFGLFEFDCASGELRREGALVRLQSQPAQVLACLIQHAGEITSREELFRTVWGDQTFVDFERGLNFCIAQIRLALGDDATAPRYIQTIPRRGYQFIAPVQRIAGPATHVIPVRASLRSSSRVVQWLCAAGLLLAVGLGWEYWRSFRHASRVPPIVAVVRFDNETGDATLTSFSDGLTDSVVEQLTALSGGRYGVVGNARVLRLGRDQRDLNAISHTLHAEYVILGQVQGSASHARILAHLIHMPDQTHLWVARIDSSIADPLAAEGNFSKQIAQQFSPRLAKAP
jgi:DNA-binding winged helix-turn-helix (wHTH) protein/TolB-like protein